ncbi:hypothetical protein OAS39_02130, partial [Pirellulales bacterium]|nr:hypothetical protein [Pirellulales bacterium]
MNWYAWLIVGAYVLLTCRLAPAKMVAARAANDAWTAVCTRGTWRLLATAGLLPCAYWGWIPWSAAALCPATLGAVELLNQQASRQVCAAALGRVYSFGFAFGSLLVMALAFPAWHFWPNDSPFADPRVRSVEALHDQVVESRQAVELQLVAMHGRFDSLGSSLGRGDNFLDQLGQFTAELIVLADQIAEDYRELVRLRDHATGLVRDTDAPARFAEAARIFRTRALIESTEGYAELAGVCEEMAQLWDAYAAAAQRQRDQPLNVELLQGVIRYVGRARDILGLIDAHIHELPVSEARVRQAELEESVRLFVEKFDLLRQHIRGLTAQLRSQTADHGEPAPPPQEKPQSPSHDVLAVTLANYRPPAASVEHEPIIAEPRSSRTAAAAITTASPVVEAAFPENSTNLNGVMRPKSVARWT